MRKRKLNVYNDVLRQVFSEEQYFSQESNLEELCSLPAHVPTSAVIAQSGTQVGRLDKTTSNIAVLIRGDITRKVVDIWGAKLGKFVDQITICDKVTAKTTHIVAQATSTEAQLATWCSGMSFDVADLSVKIVSPNWIFESIKIGKLADCKPFLLEIFSQRKEEALIPADIVQNHLLQQDSNMTLSEHKETKAEEEIITVHPDSGTTPIQKLLWVDKNRDKFLCAISGTEAALAVQNNSHIIEIFENLQNLYELIGDDFRAIVYKRACVTLAKLPHIQDAQQAANIRGIGKSLLDKIDEILETGTLKKLEAFNNNPKIQAIANLSGVWGIGAKTAESLISRYGIMSVADLRARGMGYLSAQQLVGLKYYEEFNVRIPREEVQRIETIVVEQCSKILPGVLCTVCGSYRRRKSSSGDVDILICPPDGLESISVLPQLIDELTKIGFLTDHLALPSGTATSNFVSTANGLTSSVESVTATPTVDGSDRASYMGVCALPEPGSLHRRIDIKTYPRSMYAFALLYFTGSDHFNRSMRLFASKKGYTLSDKGIALCVRDAKRVKFAVGQMIPCYSEREIFNILGLVYKEPWERNGFDNSNILLPDT